MPQYHKLENDRWKETGNWAVLKREIEKTLPNTLNWKMIVAKLSISAGSTTRPHSSLTSLGQRGEHEISVVDPAPNAFLLDPDPLVGGTDPETNHQSKIVRKTLIPTVL
jgi:hypothetical protein